MDSNDKLFQVKEQQITAHSDRSNKLNEQNKPTEQHTQQNQQSQHSPTLFILDAALEVVGELGFGQHGEDYQEEVFVKRMRYEDRKRKAKNKKRGRSL